MARIESGHQLPARALTRAFAAGALATVAVTATLAVTSSGTPASPPQLVSQVAHARFVAFRQESAATAAEPVGESPAPSEPASPTPTSPVPPTEPAPTTTPSVGTATSSPVKPGATTRRSTPPPSQPSTAVSGKPRLGVHVTTGDVRLDSGYWTRRNTTTDLRITIANTGQVGQRVQLSYTLPEGLSDAGTRGCSSADGRTYRCGAWSSAAGARWSMRVRVRVSSDAWRDMPLNGSVQVTAAVPSRPDLGRVTDSEGFVVLFPAGPPVAGMSLDASEVRFDETGGPATLDVRVGNTGDTASAGSAVEIVLPAGLSIPTLPDGCRTADPGRTTCDLGPLRPGQTGTLRVPVAATQKAQRQTPLSGAAIGTLTPHTGQAKRMQMSFRIVAAAAVSAPSPSVDAAAPPDPQGALPGFQPVSPPAGFSVRSMVATLVAVSVLLVVLALALAIASLRRRLRDESPPPGDEPVAVD